MPRYDTVLFDFGGVFTVSPFHAVTDGSRERGLDHELVHAVLFGPYGEDTDHPWHRLERGEVSLRDAHVALLALAADRGLSVDPFEFLARLGDLDPQREEIVRRTRALRAAGIRTALVTNNIAEFGDGWKALIPVTDLFDAVVDSCEAGVRKPDPAMFRLALEALGSTADRAVFLDDHEGNVAAAAASGIRSILVGVDRIAAFDDLDRVLAEEAPAAGRSAASEA